MLTKKSEELILIVDDSEGIRDVYGRFLKEKGFRVASATDGREALEEAVKLQPDLILMDLSLPRMGGRAAIQRLKKHEKTKHIPVIVMTAHSFEGAQTVIKEACEGFIIKPTPPKDMLKEITRVLHRQAA